MFGPFIHYFSAINAVSLVLRHWPRLCAPARYCALKPILIAAMLFASPLGGCDFLIRLSIP